MYHAHITGALGSSTALLRILLLFGCCLMLCSCLTMTRTSTKTTRGFNGGTQQVSFATADGDGGGSLRFTRFAGSTSRNTSVQVNLRVAVETGSLAVEVLNDDNSVAVRAQTDGSSPGVAQGVVQVSWRGRMRYRVIAQNAQNGSYALEWQR